MAKLRPIETLLDGVADDPEIGRVGGSSGQQPTIKLALFTPNRVRLALSLMVIGRFLAMWYVIYRQASLYAGLEVLPNNSLTRYINQSQWDEWRPKQAALHPFEVAFAWTYLAELAAIWLLAPLLALRSKAFHCLLHCWAKRESYDLVDNGLITATEGPLKAAVCYAVWFLIVSAMVFILNDVINTGLIAAVGEPINKHFDNHTAKRITDFVSAAGFDPHAVYVYPELMNAECAGIFDPVILIGAELAHTVKSGREILGVIAHELGHWRHSHMLINFANFELTIFLTFSATYLLRDYSPLYAAFGYTAGDLHRTNKSSSRPVVPWVLTRAKIVSLFVLWPLWALYTPLSNLLDSRLEYSADAYAGRLGYADYLCTALVRLHEGEPLVLDPIFAAVMSDHPSLANRLEKLGC